MLNVYPNDLPDEDIDVNRFGAALNRTRKHVMGGVYTVEGVRNVIKMAEIIAGSPEELRKRPFISMVTCNISPFKLDKSYGELAMEVARNRIPVVVPAEPLCGATAPITLAGNLVVQNVDTLAGVMLTQLVNPGTPVLYGCISSITDLRDMKYLSGARGNGSDERRFGSDGAILSAASLFNSRHVRFQSEAMPSLLMSLRLRVSWWHWLGGIVSMMLLDSWSSA